MNAIRLNFDPNKDKIKTLVFDLGGVYFTSGTHLTLVKLKEKYQIHKWDPLILFFSSSPDTKGGELRLGYITMDEFETKFFREFGIDENFPNHLRRIWFSNYIPYYSMPKIIENLYRKYRLIAFSGNIRERINFLDLRYDFLKNFHEKLFSYDYHFLKTQNKFFDELLNHLQCKPSEALLIDDSSVVIESAKSFGIHSILFSYTEQFITDLLKYGIKIKL